jgi:hypothetical protein
MYAAPRRAALPKSVDLRATCPKVYDQGDLGSCTANAIGAAIEFDQMKQKLPYAVPSRLFIYYNERALEGTIDPTAAGSFATASNGGGAGSLSGADVAVRAGEFCRPSAGAVLQVREAASGGAICAGGSGRRADEGDPGGGLSDRARVHGV